MDILFFFLLIKKKQNSIDVSEKYKIPWKQSAGLESFANQHRLRMSWQPPQLSRPRSCL